MSDDPAGDAPKPKQDRSDRLGRPPGSPGLRARKLRQIFDELDARGLIDDTKILLKLYELGCAGDVTAAKEYNNRRFGQAPQALQIDDHRNAVVVSPGQLTPDEWNRRYTGGEDLDGDDDEHEAN